MKKYGKYILIILFSLLPLVLSISSVLLNSNWFSAHFEKYSVDEKYPDVDLISYHKGVVGYLTTLRDEMPLDIALNERELSHMDDVRNVIIMFLVVAINLYIVLAICCIVYRKEILDIIWKAGIVSLCLNVVLILLFSLAFSSAFTAFHSLFFEEGSWMFASTDNIINIYPQGLWFDLFFYVFFVSIMFSIVMVTFSLKSFIKKRQVKK